MWLYDTVMHLKDADGMKVSVDPDQTLLQEHFDLGLHCLLRHARLKTKGQGLSGYYGTRLSVLKIERKK